jgi:hypothetical protein
MCSQMGAGCAEGAWLGGAGCGSPPTRREERVNGPSGVWGLVAGERGLGGPSTALTRILKFGISQVCPLARVGQFSVHLRLLDIAVPASWGPSADEPPLFMQAA